MRIFLLFLAEQFTLIYILRNVLHLKWTSSRLRLGICFLLTIGWAVCILLFQPPVPYTFIMIVAVFLLFCEKWHLLLCCSIVFSLILNILSNTAFYIFYIVTGAETRFVHFVLSLLSAIILLTGAFVIKQKHLFEQGQIRRISWKGYFLIGLVTIIDFFLSSVSNLLFSQNLNALGRHLLVFAIFIMIIMSIVLLLLYFRLQQTHTQLKEINTINQKMLELEVQHYKEMQRKSMDLRSFRHDYNYHVTAMQGLAAKEDWSGLKKYVAGLSDTKEQLYYISTNHPVADAIVNYFYENIPANTEFQLDGKFPETVFFDDIDLCVILSNLVKNAAEAIARLPLTSKKKLYVSLYSDEKYTSILVENTSPPYQDKSFDHLPTSKPDTLNHGLGLKNVKKVVEHYNGKLDLHYKNETFSASVFLYHSH